MDYDKYNYLKRRTDFVSSRATSHHPPSLKIEPIHQDIILKFDIPKKMIEGSVTTIFRANVASSKGKVELNAIDLEISSVSDVNRWDYDGEIISLYWDFPLKKDEKRSVKIDYKVTEPITGLYFSYPDEKYPDRAVYVVSDNESERARYWLPSLDHPTVRCSVDFFLTSVEKLTILANGILLDEKIGNDGTKTAHWKQKFPCPSYLVAFAIGDFIKYEDRSADAGIGKIPVAYYATNQFKPKDLHRSFKKTPEMLEWLFKKLKVPLEWDKYFQICTPHYEGAMENVSLVTWSNFAVLEENEAKERWWLIDDINIHEMAHSWFGDMIVISDFAHVWLKESFATFMETVYFEEFYGEQEGLYNIYSDTNTYIKESDTKYARPIVTNKYDSSWDMYDMHSYPGGAIRIRMLRSMMGDEKFWEATTDYLNTYKGKVAETIDFQRKLEEHSGLSLGSFFEQWFYKAGYPKLKVEFKYDGDHKLASIKIEQTQIDEKKHIEGFKFPLDIMWETDQGKFEQKTFQITEEKTSNFYFKCDKKPLQIRLDPDYKILFTLDFNPGDDLLIRQLESVNVIGKILAAKELTKNGKKKNIQIVADNFKNEEFWGLKIEYSKALAGSDSFEGVKALLTLLEQEKDPLVLSPMISVLTGKKHESVFEAMKKFLQRDDKPIRATSAALNVIGSQRTEEAFDFLSTYEITYDSKSIVKSGLFAALGRIRSEKSIEYLLSRRTYGLEPKSARIPLIMAIVDSLIWAKKNVRDRGIEMLTDLLQTEKEEQMIRILALQLGKFNDPSVISSINSAKSRIAEGDRPQLDRLIEKIGKGATTEEETKKLRKDFNELKSKMSKILARIEKMEAKEEIKKEK